LSKVVFAPKIYIGLVLKLPLGRWLLLCSLKLLVFMHVHISYADLPLQLNLLLCLKGILVKIIERCQVRRPTFNALGSAADSKI